MRVNGRLEDIGDWSAVLPGQRQYQRGGDGATQIQAGRQVYDGHQWLPADQPQETTKSKLYGCAAVIASLALLVAVVGGTAWLVLHG